jgi:hypothetical protein
MSWERRMSRAFYTVIIRVSFFFAKSPAYHSRTKHIQLRYHFIRSLLESGQLLLEKIRGTENPADMLTKVVTMEKLKLCAASVGLQA